MAEAVDNVPAKAGASGGKSSLPGLNFLDNISKMPVLRQVGLLVGLAASVAIGFAVVLWSQQPDYRPLVSSLAGMDTKQVMDTLATANISYSVEPNSGALLVKAEDLSRARLALASAGVVQNDGNVGFEILDKDQGLGTSQFMEATRYRRGLEGELARTISSLNGIKAARVHLAIPKSSVFVRDERKPTASVLVEMYGGRTLDPGQVMAIVNLVATSIPEMDKSGVTVVDQKGNLLSDQSNNSELAMAGKQFDYTRRMETMLTQRVQSILQPVLGNDRYKAEVSAMVDFSAVESTSEQFNPDQPALRSEQSTTEQRSSSSGPSGVPGALSNQPPAPATAPQTTAGGAAGAAAAIQPGQPLVDSNGQQIMDPATGQPMLAPYPADKRQQSTKNFELDRSISHTRQQQGRLQRLSVAVVVDDQAKLNAANGEITHTPWAAEDLARFTRLVQDAVGYDASRGDSVTVINAPFAPDAGEVIPSIPFYSQPWFWDVVKQALGVLFILVLVFGVLRPVLNNITGGGKAGKGLATTGGGEGGSGMAGMAGGGLMAGGLMGDVADDRVSLGGPQSILLPSPSEGYDAQLNAIKSLVAEDPGRVAQVVKEWINADE
jgi:flagellar M-ring protein FliF